MALRGRGFLLLFLAGMTALAACQRYRCELGVDLRELLGGGPVVCLGASFGALEDQASPGDVQSLPGVSVRDGGAVFGYEPGGGIDLVVFALSSRVERACVTPDMGDAAGARRHAHYIRVRLGGAWKVAIAPDGIAWTRPDGVQVAARTKRPFTVCVSMHG